MYYKWRRSKKKKIKIWTIKWQQTHNYQQWNFKNKNKLSKQLEQEQNHRSGDHMESYQQGSGRGREEEKVQRISSTNGRYKIDRGRLRIV